MQNAYVTFRAFAYTHTHTAQSAYVTSNAFARVCLRVGGKGGVGERERVGEAHVMSETFAYQAQMLECSNARIRTLDLPKP